MQKDIKAGSISLLPVIPKTKTSIIGLPIPVTYSEDKSQRLNVRISYCLHHLMHEIKVGVQLTMWG